MPYTYEKKSNTIQDKNTKSRTSFHCGPQHKTSGQDDTLKSDNQYKYFTKIFSYQNFSVRAKIKRALNR